MIVIDRSWQRQISKATTKLALLFSSFITPIVCFAQQDITLTGLERIEVEVSVYIDFQNADKKALNERLQRNVESILRKSELPLVEGQSLDDPLGVWLYVKLKLIDLEEQAIVMIDSSVTQGTSLLRDPTVRTMATTWNTSSWVITGKDDAIMYAEEKIEYHMNMLAKDFRTFNQ